MTTIRREAMNYAIEGFPPTLIFAAKRSAQVGAAAWAALRSCAVKPAATRGHWVSTREVCYCNNSDCQQVREAVGAMPTRAMCLGI